MLCLSPDVWLWCCGPAGVEQGYTWNVPDCQLCFWLCCHVRHSGVWPDIRYSFTVWLWTSFHSCVSTYSAPDVYRDDFTLAGGHLNPAVTFALCLLGRERWRKFPVYFVFQTIGAFFGAAIIFGMYYGKNWLQISQIFKYCMFVW